MKAGIRAQSMEHRAQGRECKYRSLILFLCPLLFALCVTGCGYTLHGRADLPFQSVGVGKIVNKTFEPKLEDKLQVALAEELMKSGFVLENLSGYRIDGVINGFELRILSEKEGVAVQYEVIIRGDFRLLEPSGKTKALRRGGVFIVSFLSTGSLNEVIASKEEAIERALRDLSAEIVASIIFE